jgi:hypothetical protein
MENTFSRTDTNVTNAEAAVTYLGHGPDQYR